MQLRIWIALLVVINVGLLYFVVEAWHAQEADQLAEVTGRQSAVEEGVNRTGLTLDSETPYFDQPNQGTSPDGPNRFGQTPTADVRPATSCEYLGPFEWVNAGDDSKALTVPLVLGKQRGEHTYRLVTKPYGSKEAAYDTVKRLRLIGIDSFVVTSGPFAGAISLGIFKEKQTALSVRDEIDAQTVLEPSSIAIVPDVQRWPQWWVAGTEIDLLEALLADGLVAKIGAGESLVIPCEKLEKFALN